MKLQFLGQNCFLLQVGGKNYLTDPFYNFKIQASGFNLKKQEIHGILVTHAHGDHTADVEEVLSAWPEAVLVAQPEICGYFKPKNKADINFGGTWNAEGFSVTMVPARHTSSFPDGTYGGEASGFIFKTNEKTIYMSGDTGITGEMSLLAELYGRIDTAILCLGGHYTMDPEQASFAAAELIQTGEVIGCHFDTFSPIEIDHERAFEIFEKRQLNLQLPQIGQWIDL